MESVIIYLLIGLVGILSAFIVTLSAGLGIYNFAGLTLLGVPAQIAVATNKASSLASQVASFHIYFKKKKIIWRYVIPFTIFNVLGAFIGAKIMVSIPEEIFTKIVGIVLVILIPFLFFKKDIGVVQKTVSKLKEYLYHCVYFVLQIYRGFFGAGVGFFQKYLLTAGYGMTMLQTKGTTKIPAFCSTITSIAVFAYAGFIHWGMQVHCLLDQQLEITLGHTSLLRSVMHG